MLRKTSLLLITAALLSSCAPQRLSARQSLKESSHSQYDTMEEVRQSISSIRKQLLDISSKLNISDTSTLIIETERVTEVFDTAKVQGQQPQILTRTLEKSSARKRYGVTTSSETQMEVSSMSSDTASNRQNTRVQSLEQSDIQAKTSISQKKGLKWYQKGLIWVGAGALVLIAGRLASIYFKPYLSGLSTLFRNLLNKIKL